MRINKFFDLYKVYINNKDIIEENKLLSGKIIDTKGYIAMIDIRGIGTIKASTESNLKGYVGKELPFLIKSVSPNEVKLKPIIDDYIEDNTTIPHNDEKYLRDILRKFNINDDPVSIEFLKNIIRYNIQINEDSLNKGIDILDKLNRILNLKDEEIVISNNLNENIIDVEKEDISNLLIIDNNYTKVYKKTELKINNYIKNEIDSNLIKTIAFFIKYKVKPTLNNIKYFVELNEEPDLFLKDYEVFKNIIDKEFTNYYKNIIIGNESQSEFNLEKSNYYVQHLDKLSSLIKSDEFKSNNKIDSTIEEFTNKVELLKEINQELVFIYLPLIMEKSHPFNVITFFKKRKKKNSTDGKMNFLISLNTNNLGKIKIICSVFNSSINIKFGNLEKEDIQTFNSQEESLKTLIRSTGYEIDSIEYTVKEEASILDTLIVNHNPLYYLDVQV